MKKAILVLAISTVFAAAALAQSLDAGQRQSGPNGLQNHVLIHKFSPNNKGDFVGYMELNVYNVSSSVFEPNPARRSGDRPVEPKRRRL